MTFEAMACAKLTDAMIPTLTYPVYASPKLDGIRAIVIDGVVMSRRNKPIPNRHIQKLFGKPQYNGLDGELIVGPATSPTCYNNTSSGVMSHDGEPDVTFYVFDYAGLDHQYSRYIKRMTLAEDKVETALISDLVMLKQTLCHTPAEVLAHELECLILGYEGTIVRSVTAPYKHGRSTASQGYIFKLKRFTDSEAVIIGFQEELRNDNEQTVNDFGRSQRQSLKEFMVPKGTLGAFKCKDCVTGVEFDCGSGLTAIAREVIWSARDKYIGKIIKYKHFEVGVKDKPRFPTFLGFRDKIDA